MSKRYRSLKRQRYHWQREYDELSAKNPGMKINWDYVKAGPKANVHFICNPKAFVVVNTGPEPTGDVAENWRFGKL